MRLFEEYARHMQEADRLGEILEERVAEIFGMANVDDVGFYHKSEDQSAHVFTKTWFQPTAEQLEQMWDLGFKRVYMRTFDKIRMYYVTGPLEGKEVQQKDIR